LTVNQRVAGSSPASGAKMGKHEKLVACPSFLLLMLIKQIDLYQFRESSRIFCLTICLAKKYNRLRYFSASDLDNSAPRFLK